MPPPLLPGLSDSEASSRLLKWGPNEPVPTKRGGPLWQTLVHFVNPLTIILLVAALVSFLLGSQADATIIVAIVVLSLALSYYQTRQSHRAVEELRARVTLTATVYRGSWKEVPRRDVVPGDVVHLSAGDLVPADAWLLEERDLHVQEAALTGESVPAEKSVPATVDLTRLAGQPMVLGDPGAVFQGTSVLGGTATALVVSTGDRTAFGKVASQLAGRRPETEFEQGIGRFSRLISETIVLLVLFIVLAGIIRGTDPLETLLFALALAVGLTPEFLPVILTITLSRGAVRMARKNVIVKNLESIQNFGSIDVLCSDKTGTLTRGVMTLEASQDWSGSASPRPLALGKTNSRFQTGLANPLDQALLDAPGSGASGEVKVDEVPFDFDRRRLSVVVEAAGQRTLITKGAPESVLPCCISVEDSGGVRPLDPAALTQAEATYQRASESGQRCLAVAYRNVPSQPRYDATDERGLVLAGFLLFADPPLEEVGATLEALRQDGIEVKILTGDNEAVARHVCRQVGMESEPLLLGSELDQLSDSALRARVAGVHVFARVSPAQKTRVILALRSVGRVVGYIGDGVNDAPSMHAADVGISVMAAVDVAREAADVILLKRDLRVLHDGIVEGRQAFGNVIKYILMGTSSNFGNMFSMAGAFLFLPFLPMLPQQILLNNFLYDMTQTTIPTDNVDPTLTRKPRRWDIGLIRNFMVLAGPVSSIFDFLTFYLLLTLLPGSQVGFHTGWFIESLGTQTLVVFIIRTTGNPLRNLPSRPLTAAVLGVVAFGWVLPYTALGTVLGFAPLPPVMLLLIAGVTAAYLVLMVGVRSYVMRPLTENPPLRANPRMASPV